MNVIFDLDGTLVDTREGILQSFRWTFRELGFKSPSDQDLMKWVGPPLSEGLLHFLGQNNQALVPKGVKIFRQRYAEEGVFEHKLFDGVKSCLDLLAGGSHRLYIATSKPGIFAEQIIRSYQLSVRFEKIVGSKLDGTMSNKAEILAFVLRETGILAEDSVMVGDREHDMRGAKANGIRALGAGWGYGSTAELTGAGAECVCDSPEALVRFLAKDKYFD